MQAIAPIADRAAHSFSLADAQSSAIENVFGTDAVIHNNLLSRTERQMLTEMDCPRSVDGAWWLLGELRLALKRESDDIKSSRLAGHRDGSPARTQGGRGG